MIHARHREVANHFAGELKGVPEGPSLGAAARAVRSHRDHGFRAPLHGKLWPLVPVQQSASLTNLNLAGFGNGGSTKVLPVNLAGFGNGGHEAASRVEQQFRDQVLFERLLAQDRAMILSQAGPGAGTAFSVVPTGFLTQIPLHLFRVVLLRRFRSPLPLSGGLHSRAPLLVSAERRVVVLGRIA